MGQEEKEEKEKEEEKESTECRHIQVLKKKRKETDCINLSLFLPLEVGFYVFPFILVSIVWFCTI